MFYVEVKGPYYIKGTEYYCQNDYNKIFPMGSRITIGEEYCSNLDENKTRIFIGDGKFDVAKEFEINYPVIANDGK